MGLLGKWTPSVERSAPAFREKGFPKPRAIRPNRKLAGCKPGEPGAAFGNAGPSAPGEVLPVFRDLRSEHGCSSMEQTSYSLRKSRNKRKTSILFSSQSCALPARWPPRLRRPPRRRWWSSSRTGLTCRISPIRLCRLSPGCSAAAAPPWSAPTAPGRRKRNPCCLRRPRGSDAGARISCTIASMRAKNPPGAFRLLIRYLSRTGFAAPAGAAVFLGTGPAARMNFTDVGPVPCGGLADALHRAGKKTAAVGNADVWPDLRDRAASVLAADSRGLIDMGMPSAGARARPPMRLGRKCPGAAGRTGQGFGGSRFRGCGLRPLDGARQLPRDHLR